MARRLPSQPPVLPGFSHLHVVGSGGFADVFLYEQNMPRRQVAVKVMLREIVSEQVRSMFQAEANLMAQLSAHPSILTVYQAGVSADGRPYLVMELCSPSLNERYRSERLPVDEVLRIGVRIGSAVETAHRAGVLHRDIKPSNILLTAYGHPVLSDFGIAAALSEAGQIEAVGMSIPWSAPEVLLDESSGSVASEVWSLAATVYSLLAGRSPFELAGDPNRPADLIARISKARPEPIGRSDVPVELERLLARAMSRRPQDRPASAIEFVRELQAIESQLGLVQTPAEIAVDDWAVATVSELEERTRLRGARDAVPAPGRNRRRRSRNEAPDRAVPMVTVRGSTPSLSVEAAPGRGMQVLAWSLITASVLVIALGAVATFVLLRAGSDQIPRVTDIAATQTSGRISFTWSDPGLAAGDRYQITTSTGAPPSLQEGESFAITPSAPVQRVCVTVTVSRDGRLGPPSNEKCVDPTG